MLIQRDQSAYTTKLCQQSIQNGKTETLTKRRRCQQGEHNAVARPIALKHLTLNQSLTRTSAQLLPDLFLSFPKRKRLGLREKVGQEDAVMFRVFDGVVRRCWGDEICRDELGALVDKLVEGVLAVGTGGTPDDGLFFGGEK